jgi:DNA-binding NarL/FixJ family response regulator
MKQADIATIVGISESNVRVKIHRIKEKLTENSNAMTETNFKELWQAQTQLRIQILKKLYLKQNIYKGKQG